MASSVTDILSLVPTHKNIRVAEIGVRYGESTQTLLSNFSHIEKYYAIDPFISYEDYEGDGFNETLKQKGGDQVYRDFLNQFGNDPRMEVIRKFSSEAHLLIQDEELDFCFIDGNHEYKYVYDDLTNYYPKMRMGGVMSGDDYFMRHKDNDVLRTLEEGEYPSRMVYEAVQEFFNEEDHRGEIIEIGTHRGYPKSWAVRKI